MFCSLGEVKITPNYNKNLLSFEGPNSSISFWFFCEYAPQKGSVAPPGLFRRFSRGERFFGNPRTALFPRGFVYRANFAGGAWAACMVHHDHYKHHIHLIFIAIAGSASSSSRFSPKAIAT
jgi:hypothetical protein